MKKFMKQVTKTVQSGAETMVNAADLIWLDTIVEKNLQKTTDRIRCYNYSAIASREEIATIAEGIFDEGYEEYDRKVGTTDDEKSNIAVRRRNLRRGYKTKLELFYQLYDEHMTQSAEKLIELKQVDDLMEQTRQDIQNQFQASTTTAAASTTPSAGVRAGLEMPDALRVKYEAIQNNQLELFQRKLSDLKLTHLSEEVIRQKIETLTEQMNELKAQSVEKRERAVESLWNLIQQELRLTDQSIQEKKTFLLSSLPLEAKSLTRDLTSFHETVTARLRRLLPNGEDEIAVVTVYMIQHQDVGVSAESVSLEDVGMKASTAAGDTSGEDPTGYLTLQDIRQALYKLQDEVKRKNLEAVIAKTQLLIASYGYQAADPIRLLDSTS